ncbi:hypothetical protein CO180_03840 [candidate division WWE3 bacterium CG_4_9_14_3_um_filter_41_6]|uniref:Uncharacterized protein n=1 Tax=candidate division WWE3 bacterium CG_4_10_14_0_2_um_filter_41_14 TaxID=1975072 RepID=A0A2M7TIA9_UNCKA|nr:MAG: hypothetical protein COY32_04015 [candidate division WWE3 bacterium CG_4_10_14_0_2_um_filter_41_14]PJA38322.1 MAG: hypothetical protein CO180_03840 [candidate division WWE3 bacterium CG_4_9_14_3_um_filter_41_6]
MVNLFELGYVDIDGALTLEGRRRLAELQLQLDIIVDNSVAHARAHGILQSAGQPHRRHATAIAPQTQQLKPFNTDQYNGLMVASKVYRQVLAFPHDGDPS